MPSLFSGPDESTKIVFFFIMTSTDQKVKKKTKLIHPIILGSNHCPKVTRKTNTINQLIIRTNNKEIIINNNKMYTVNFTA